MIEVEKLIQWFRKNKRPLPWRKTSDPYQIWLSEIILQQTRVSQGLPYYLKFIKRYPTVYDLAVAQKDEIFKLWQGLGYYRRAENLMKAAKMIVEEFNGVFPKHYSKLKTLPGVGEYTAAAIASIASGEKVAVVDGNVYRVLARLLGVETPIQTNVAKKKFSALSVSLMQNHHPGEFNEALMEFGALQCVPVNPDCNRCIFVNRCYAFNNKKVAALPVANPKKKKRKLFLYYLVVEWQNQVVLRHRTENDIWKGLYDFPSLDFEKKLSPEEVMTKINKISWLTGNKQATIVPINKTYKHQLTHIDVSAQFINIMVIQKPDIQSNNKVLFVLKPEIRQYPVHKLIERFLKDYGLGM